MKQEKRAVYYAVLAAALYALSSPVSKLLLQHVSETMMAAGLYLGAGIGCSIVLGMQRVFHGTEGKEKSLEWKEWPYILGMILLDIAAPVLLMLGLRQTTAANVSLLNNFEIVATAVIALCIFHEKISRRLWCAIGLVTLASIMLSFEDINALSFSQGAIYVLAATTCWGLENNCTRKLSDKNPIQIVIVKGFGSGMGALVIARVTGGAWIEMNYILWILLLGFTAYGLSILFYVKAQRYLGAAKTSAYYSIAPFFGVMFSFIIYHELPGRNFSTALFMMMAGTYLATRDSMEAQIVEDDG